MRPSALAAVLLLALVGLVRHAGAAELVPVTVAATPVAMDAKHPGEVQAGPFRYAGGLWLKGPREQGFGGLSDLRISSRGELVAVSDEGALYRARLVLDEHGRLEGVRDSSLQRLTDEHGEPFERKVDSDAEGLVVWPSGELMVSFEHRHRIWLYPRNGGPPQALPMPHVSMPANEGMEGLSLAPSQGADAYWVGVERGSVWLCHRHGDCQRWKGMPGPGLGCRLSGLAEASGARLVLLHHCFNPFTSASHVRVMIVAIPRSPAAVPTELAELKINPPMTVDNLEGVEPARAPDGGLRLYLISDDNFSDTQRTLLLAYDLPAPDTGRRSR